MIKILTKKRKIRLAFTVIVLSIVLGSTLYLFINLFSIFDVSNYRTYKNYTIEYSQGFGGVNVDFRMSYRSFANFDTALIFQTISSEEIEEIGITDVDYNVYRDVQQVWDRTLNFPEPILYGFDSFIIAGISQFNNLTSRGTIYAQFNVSGIVQYENIDFELFIIMPVNPLEIRHVHLMNLIWAEYGLGVLMGVLILFLGRTIQLWRREATYTEEDEQKDEEFYDYLGEKLEEFKKESP